MKKKVLFFAAIIMLVACNSNEPSDNSSKENKSWYNILYKGKSPYLDLYFSNMEYFVSYASDINPNNEEMHYSEKVNGTEDNTITLKNGMKIRLQDDYKLNNEGNLTTLQLTRTATRVMDDVNNAPRRSKADGGAAITHSYSYSIQSAQPIQIIRPAVDECNPMPLCYYEDLEIEWNEDSQNANGVVVIADWTGSILNGPSQDTRVANVDIVEDTGVAVLSSSLFDNMPDEALVDLWLIRGNMITISGDGEISLSDALENSPEEIEDLLAAHPELCTQLQPYMFGTGAVVRLPFVLIREL